MKTLFVIVGDSLRSLASILNMASEMYDKTILLVPEGFMDELEILRGSKVFQEYLDYSFRIDLRSEEGILSIADLVISEPGTPSLAIIGEAGTEHFVKSLNTAMLLRDFLEKVYVVDEGEPREVELVNWRLGELKDYEVMILNTLTVKREMKLREIAARLGRSSSYVNKVLVRLMNLGLVERGKKRGSYRITVLGRMALTMRR